MHLNTNNNAKKQQILHVGLQHANYVEATHPSLLGQWLSKTKDHPGWEGGVKELLTSLMILRSSMKDRLHLELVQNAQIRN